MEFAAIVAALAAAAQRFLVAQQLAGQRAASGDTAAPAVRFGRPQTMLFKNTNRSSAACCVWRASDCQHSNHGVWCSHAVIASPTVEYSLRQQMPPAGPVRRGDGGPAQRGGAAGARTGGGLPIGGGRPPGPAAAPARPRRLPRPQVRLATRHSHVACPYRSSHCMLACLPVASLPPAASTAKGLCSMAAWWENGVFGTPAGLGTCVTAMDRPNPYLPS